MLTYKPGINIGNVDRLPFRQTYLFKEMNNMVYILSQDGTPLMPTERHGKVRRILNEGKAKVVKARQFTIQLMYETAGYTQPATLGLDSGYSHVGFSAVNVTKELIAGELELLHDQVERNKERSMYRIQRRNRLRHRAKRFNNRRKPAGWLAPSLQNKLDTHIRLVDKISALVPVSKVVVEVAAFDIQEIKTPESKVRNTNKESSMTFGTCGSISFTETITNAKIRTARTRLRKKSCRCIISDSGKATAVIGRET